MADFHCCACGVRHGGGGGHLNLLAIRSSVRLKIPHSSLLR